MTLQQLRYAIMVSEKGSISEAAKALFISQPSLTNAIKELENEKIRANESLQALKIQKPSWFSWGKERQIYIKINKKFILINYC